MTASANSHAIDPAVRQVAAVYAKALVSATEAAGQTESVLDELDAVVSDLLRPFPKFNEMMISQLVSVDDRVAALDRALGSKLSQLALNFLKVLVRHGRFECLPAAAVLAREQLDELRGRVRVQVTTAAPMGDGLASQLKESLRAMLGGEPILSPSVDPELVGGVVLRVGDAVYDGSVATQLQKMRGQMINRSVHEIQSRRDRFSNPAGN